MQITPPSPLAAGGASAGPVPAGPAASPGEASPFAKMLSAQRSAAKSGAAGSNERPAIDEAQAPAANDAKAGPAQGARSGPVRAPAAPGPKGEAGDAAPLDDAALSLVDIVRPEGEPGATPAGSEQDETPADPALRDWLATLHAPVQAAPAGVVPVPGESAVMPDAPGVATDTARAGWGKHAGAARGAAAASHRGEPAAELPAGTQALAGDAPARASAEAATAASWRADGERPAPRVESLSTPEVSAVHAAAAAARPEGAAAATSVVTVATPATSPEFREALAVQVSVLAKDGVQRAELHLNPAEMGPISVQIALQGTQAQVDFGADSFATRQVIEAGLPELAAALRDAGFTLSGGGVSQQSRGQSQEQGQSHGVMPRGSEKDEVPTRPVSVRMRQGGVDLYA